MLIPLILLSMGAIFAGYVFSPFFVESESFWKGSIAFNEHLMHEMHGVPVWVKLSASVAMLIGLAVAWLAYIKDTSIPGKFVAQFSQVHAFLYNKWYFDELYNFLFVRPAFWLGNVFWKRGDVGLIDRFGPNGAAWIVERGAVVAKRIQSGYLYSYALVMLLGLIAAISWVMVR